MTAVYKAACAAIETNVLHDGADQQTCGLKEHCCLCFKFIAPDSEAVSVDDLVFYDSNNGQRSEEMASILLAVLGNACKNNMDVFKTVCEPCSKAALSSYKFIQHCKENVEQFTAAVENMMECFKNLADNVDNFQTLYINVNAADQTFEQIYDNKKIDSKENALPRLHHLLSANTVTFTNDVDIMVEKKREKDLSTIFYKTHELMANPDSKVYQCKMCMKTYPLAGSLRLHFFSVHFKKEFQCSMCPKSFGTAGLLHTHEKTSHSLFACEVCGKNLLNRPSTIKRHLRLHCSKEVKTCHRCGRTYKKKNDFYRHLERDSCEMPSRIPGDYICDHCGKHYHFKHQLKTHIKFEHSNAEGFVCKWCSRKCYNQSALNIHILKHTGEKKFICGQCGGKFVTRQSLINHTRLHTGERPYPCGYCDQSFLSASRRKEHIERHHFEGMFQCDLCDAKYSARRSLVKHKKSHFVSAMAEKNYQACSS